MNILTINQIVYFEIDVSEKIEDKNLKDFIFTSLKLKNIPYTNQDKLAVNFVSQINQYQIFLLNKKFDFLEFQIFESLYENKDFVDDIYDLYICDDFFILYKNAIPYYFQRITNEINSNEFIEFLNRKFNIDISSFNRIDSTRFEELKNLYKTKKDRFSFKFINIKNNHSFMIYLLFLVFLISIFFSFILNFENEILKKEEKINQSISFDELKNKYKFESVEKNIRPLFLAFEKYELNLIKMEFEEKSLNIVFESVDKNHIYSFLEEYKNIVINSSIKYLEDKKTYEVGLNVQISE